MGYQNCVIYSTIAIGLMWKCTSRDSEEVQRMRKLKAPGLIALLTFGAVTYSGCEFSDPAMKISTSAPETPAKVDEKLADVMGIRNPVTCPADRVDLPDDAVVMGVVVRDKARAYLLDALSIPVGTVVTQGVDDEGMRLLARHVVNDRLNGIPISVTFCDDLSCKQVFTANQKEALELRVGGARGDKMLLRYRDATFEQDAEATPLDRYPFVKATWFEWRTKHPQTDIYLGHLQAELCRGE